MSSPPYHSSSSHLPPPAPPPPNKAWRPWSVPLDPQRMTRDLCGLLNKLAPANFEAVATKIARWAIAVEATGENGALDAFVQAIFARGVQDSARVALFGALCARVVDELEGERNAWKKVDLYHVGNPLRSFETVLRLLPNTEFQFALARGDEVTLFALLAFTAELLVQGILYIEDTQEILGLLFNRAYRNDATCTIGLARFTRPILKAFNAISLLNSLEITKGIEHALQSPDLSRRVRYILLALLDQVAYPQPPDAFNSSRERIEAYGIDPDTDDEDEDALMDTDELDMPRLLQSCRERAAIFFERRSHEFAQRALLDLLPEHRHYFFRQLIADVLARHDADDARLVGTLWLLEDTHALCQEDHAFLRGLEAELAVLHDTILDVPDACQLLAAMLHETPLDVQVLESLIWQVVQPEDKLRERLLGELTARGDPVSGGLASESRQNRFDRTFGDFSLPGSSSGAYKYQ